jgi:hypothetical protein
MANGVFPDNTYEQAHIQVLEGRAVGVQFGDLFMGYLTVLLQMHKLGSVDW